MNKIILIDDNKSNQRESYGADFVDNEEYEDCLVHKEQLNENSDFSFLDDAVCVLLHDSLADYVDGQYVSGGRMAKESVKEKIKANKTPFVVFSDGHSIIGDWSQAKPDEVRSIKKSEFYRNLKGFLDAYRETGHIDLRLIAYGSEFKKREIVCLLQQIFEELNIVNDKESLTLSSIDADLLEHFFGIIKHVSNNMTFEKLCDRINAGQLSVGKFKAYINSLASHAIRYTGIVPKQNILLLGNELSQARMSDLNNVTFKTLNTFQLGEKGEKAMFDNIASCIPSDTDAIILDIDSTKTPDACLSYALAIRLSLWEKRKAALAPIIFMSSLTPEIFKNSPYSTLLQTKGVSFETPLYTPAAVELMEPLAPKDYRPYFLELIKVKPNSTEGIHSIANQWGADILNRMALGGETNNSLILNARKSLYFKYVHSLTLDEKMIDDICKDVVQSSESTTMIPIDGHGKRILLIDDEAEKGWSDVLSRMIKNAQFQTIHEQVTDYESFSMEAKSIIESNNYDLIFLDLRMNGIKEENIINTNEFSGMKILSTIKKRNRGVQVIMFTASNKAWNMKALLDAGADGYYIKESPEYAFSLKYSLSNTKSLYKNIKRCLERSYLKDIAGKIKIYKKALADSDYDVKFVNQVSLQLDVAYTLISTAITQQQFAFAYISLEQILEIISDEFIVQDNYHYLINETQEECKDWILSYGQCRPGIIYSGEDYPQWKKICSLYYQLWNGADSTFGEEINFLISKRNAFMHNDKGKLKRTDINKKKMDIYSKDGFIRLFNMVSIILNCVLE